MAAKNAGLWERTLVVDYHDMIFDIERQIKKVCNFLDIPYKTEAKDVIRKDLYRSNISKKNDNLANKLYNCIRNKNFDNIDKPIKKFVEKRKIKEVKWLDDCEYRVWVMINWETYKALRENDKEIRDKLRSTAIINRLPKHCIYYDPCGKEYTIRRVRELHDITRNKIKCDEVCYVIDPEYPEVILKRPRGEVTREFCFGCWQSKLYKEILDRDKQRGLFNEH